MTHLQSIFDRFLRRLDALENLFSDWAADAPSRLQEKDLLFLEGLISNLWQHWSLFCRRVVFASALGCITRNGITISSCVNPQKWERVSYLAWRAKSNGSVQPLSINNDLKKEPTWGDVIKIQSIISALALNNRSHLDSCFGSITRGPAHLQIIRNATAHRNFQTFNDVKNLGVYYVARPIRHPAETVIWSEPKSKDYAFIVWVDEMRIIADLITS